MRTKGVIMRKQITLRKLTLAVLAAVLCVLLAVGGISLGAGLRTYADEEPGHQHTGEISVVYPASCAVPGLGIQYCEECGKSVTVVLPPDGYSHDVENGVCKICGKKVAGTITSDESDDSYTFTANKGTGEGEAEKRVVVPGELNGKPVKLTTTSFQDNATVEEVVIQGVASIPSAAFTGCTALTTVIFEDGTTSIGANAFSGCTKLETIVLPDTLTSIGANAFDDTAYYKNTENWEDGALYYGKGENETKYLLGVKEGFLTAAPAAPASIANSPAEPVKDFYAVKEGTTVIADGVFSGKDDLKSVSLPNGLLTIGRQAFQGTSLKSVTLPASLVTIGDNAFNGTELASVNFSGLTALTSIGAGAFQNTKLTAIDLSGLTALTSIGDNAFNLGTTNAKNVTTLKLPEKLETVGASAFAGIAVSALTLPDSLKSIGASAFDAVKGDTLTLPTTLTTLGNNAFAAMTPTTLTLPETLTTLGTDVVATSKLTYVIFNDGIKDIAFLNGLNSSQTIKLFYNGEELPADYAALTNAYVKLDTDPLVQGNFWHDVNGTPTPWHKAMGLTVNGSVVLHVGEELTLAKLTEGITVTVNYDIGEPKTKTLTLGETSDLDHYVVVKPNIADENGLIKAETLGNTYKVSVQYLYLNNTFDLTIRNAKHTLTLDFNLDAADDSDILVIEELTDGEPFALNDAKVTYSEYLKPYYTFAGWKLNEKKTYQKSDSVTLTSDLTLTAQWEVNKPKITLDLGNAKATGVETKDIVSTFTHDGADPAAWYYTLTIPANKVPTLADHKFSGWTVTFNGTAVTAETTGGYKIPLTDGEMKVTVTANWAQLYAIAFEGENVSANLAAGKIHLKGETILFTLTVKEGYKLTSVKNGTTELTPNADGKYSVTVDEADITITATTAPVEVTATVNGADDVTATVTKSGNTATVTLSKTQPAAQDNKKFTGWTITVDGAEKSLNDGALEFPLGNADHAVVFTANWVDLYTVNYTITEGFEENVHVTFDVQGPYENGTIVYFTVTADPAYEIKSVKVGEQTLTGTNNKYSVTVNGNVVVAIEVANNAFTVTLAVNGTDNVAGNTAAFDQEIANKTFAYNAKLTLTVGVANGYVVEVTVNGTKVNLTANKYELTVTVNANVVVTFHKKTYTATSASLALNANKVTLTIGGTYSYYTKAEVEDLLKKENFTVAFKKGTEALASAPQQTLAVTDNGTWTMTFEVTSFADTYAVYFGDAQLKLAGQTATDIFVDAANAGAKKYSLTFGTDGAVSVGCTTVAKPTFTFEKGDGQGTTAPAAPAFKGACNEQGVYTVTLPENTYTAPANKYFRGWEIKEIVYFPGEQFDALAGTTVTANAVWAELIGGAKTNTSIVIPYKFDASATPVYVREGTTLKLVAEIADTTPVFWKGLINDGPITLGNKEYFPHFRVDGYVWTTGVNVGDSNNGPDELKVRKETESNFVNENYTNLYQGGATATHVITVSLNNNELTYIYETYATSAYTMGGGAPTTKMVWQTQLGYPASVIMMKFMIDDGDSKTMSVKNATLTYYDTALSANQTPTAEKPIVIGTEDNSLPYTGDSLTWVGDLKKGETVVMTGTMTSLGTENFHSPLMFVFDGAAPAFKIRSDNYIIGNTSKNDWPMTTSNGWKITSDGGNTAGDVEWVENDFWKGVKQILTKADLEITFDYTGENIVVTFKATGTGENDNKGKKYVCTFTISKDAGAFADTMFIGLGGEHCYAKITSLTRTSNKPTETD